MWLKGWDDQVCPHLRPQGELLVLYTGDPAARFFGVSWRALRTARNDQPALFSGEQGQPTLSAPFSAESYFRAWASINDQNGGEGSVDGWSSLDRAGNFRPEPQTKAYRCADIDWAPRSQLVDGSGIDGEWLALQNGTQRRRQYRKVHR